MFELPEVVTLARQANETLKGKAIASGCLGNVAHKFVWYNTTHAQFERLTKGKTLTCARAEGKWLFIDLEPGYVLVLGEFGGRMLYHPAGSRQEDKYHLALAFEDGSFLTVLTQMWGAMELFEQGKERERKYIKDMRPTPVDAEFTFDYFSFLVDSKAGADARSAKGLLTQNQLIPGLGNAIAQDILFHAHLHPKHLINELNKRERRALYRAIVKTVRKVIDQGGRNDELDLFGNPGRYERIMDKRAAGHPCPECGKRIVKIAYLGGACYFCPGCQV